MKTRFRFRKPSARTFDRGGRRKRNRFVAPLQMSLKNADASRAGFTPIEAWLRDGAIERLHRP
jgi:hypothetical protein